ncbi:hypothetical protein BGZ49_004114 [Haplosporangium sp. Z 27]|nr:hypothetical protein BGZ49_004114 [Haplosporangium sp. Z 27]
MASGPQYFLKTRSILGEPPSPYADLYLRHHGSGINSIVVTPGSPKFIKAHDENGRITFTSASHEGRRWGLTLRTDGTQRAGWEKVEIVENGGSEGLVWTEIVGDKESVLECGTEENDEKIWRGWMVCEWATGHPTLFWMTDKLKGELPAFCHRVQIVRETL